jgi:hypothetical protein
MPRMVSRSLWRRVNLPDEPFALAQPSLFARIFISGSVSTGLTRW